MFVKQQKTRTAYIYGLRDPFDGDIKYVGKSFHPRRRLRSHLGEARRCRKLYPSVKVLWLRDLLAVRARPELVILEETTAHEWPVREQYWIRRLRPCANTTYAPRPTWVRRPEPVIEVNWLTGRVRVVPEVTYG